MSADAVNLWRTREDLESRLAGADPELAAILLAALESGEGSPEWQTALFELGAS